MLKHFCPNLLHLALPSRLDSHGTGDHSAADSETIRPPDSAAANLAETGWTGTGLALRWGRHHHRWRSAGIKETGGANGNPAAVRPEVSQVLETSIGWQYAPWQYWTVVTDGRIDRIQQQSMVVND